MMGADELVQDSKEAYFVALRRKGDAERDGVLGNQ